VQESTSHEAVLRPIPSAPAMQQWRSGWTLSQLQKRTGRRNNKDVAGLKLVGHLLWSTAGERHGEKPGVDRVRAKGDSESSRGTELWLNQPDFVRQIV